MYRMSGLSLRALLTLSPECANNTAVSSSPSLQIGKLRLDKLQSKKENFNPYLLESKVKALSQDTVKRQVLSYKG